MIGDKYYVNESEVRVKKTSKKSPNEKHLRLQILDDYRPVYEIGVNCFFPFFS